MRGGGGGASGGGDAGASFTARTPRSLHFSRRICPRHTAKLGLEGKEPHPSLTVPPKSNVGRDEWLDV